MANPYDEMIITIPQRSDSALTGTEFGKQILGSSSLKREEMILSEFQTGNVPSWNHNLCEITVEKNNNRATFFCLPDYLCIGSDDDFIRMPMLPGTAQKIADQYNCILPNRLMVNEIWKASTKLSPQPLPPGPNMVTSKAYIDHNNLVNLTLRNKGIDFGKLIAGHQKDIVICKNIPSNKVVIYGWHQLNGTPIQGLNSTSHNDLYVDYSQTVRLIAKSFILNDQPSDIELFLKNDKDCLLSDEGPMITTRYR